MTTIDQQFANLSPEKRKLIELLLQQKQAEEADTVIRPRLRQAAGAPLSFAQQRLWFLDQFEPNSAVYNMPLVVHLRGALDLDALRSSLNLIVQRHEALRTTFPDSEGQPRQVIAPTLALALPVIDLTGLPEGEREAQARQQAVAKATQPFDLAHGPLVRVIVWHLGREDHLMLLNIHHIVSDGWSQGILLRELAALYPACVAGQPSPLPPLPIQYADFAAWQREWLQGEVLATQLDYWKRQLAGLPKLGLPTDYARSANPTFRGARQQRRLSKSLSTALNGLSGQVGVTLFMTCLAAFSVVLYRYTGQADIGIGSAIANRNRAEIEGLIGFFVNTLVLRTRLDGNPTFRQLLRQVREMALEAYAHQDLPFEKLVEELQPERDLQAPPLFQVAFVFQNTPLQAPRSMGLTMERVDIETVAAKFELTLGVVETPAGVQMRFDYSTDLFSSATIKRMLMHLQHLLEAVVADPDQRVAELPLLSEAEREQLLIRWNNTWQPRPTGACLLDWWQAAVARGPDAVAIAHAGAQLTYAALERQANQLAHYLQSLGVGPEMRVGLCLDRSIALVIGALGVLKAGGAYVPLDPAYPAERLAFMLTDSGASVVLSQKALAPTLPATTAPVVCLDTDWPSIAQSLPGPRQDGAISNPSPDPAGTGPSLVMPDNLAYVIYTSGSTGRPKGVSISHAGLLNLVAWHQRVYQVTPTDRATQLAGVAFDASVWELWPYLTAGASIHIPDEATRASVPALVDWLAAEAITLSFLPTPLAEVVLAADWPSTLALKYLLTGGDQLHHGPQRRLPFSLVNHYGPTENTVVTTWTPVTVEAENDAAPAIGKPIDNTQVYLLDRYLQPVPIGVPGELHIGGLSLARGYLNRPELTAEKFIPNPFPLPNSHFEKMEGGAGGTRLYKTGDLARYLPASRGDIEFLGRIDQQVKIRGFRIELGEIESALTQHPAVREAVVMAREDRPGEKRLVAYLVAPASPPTVGELRNFLGEKLPDYMLPALFVFLEALPLTPNGKVDRQVLRLTDRRPDGEGVPDPAHAPLAATFVAPQSAVEETLAQIWAEVLGIKSVGITDNFFELGGDSILSIQIIARARAKGLPLLPKHIFQHQTIAALAAVVGQAPQRQAEQGIVVGPVPLTAIQRWFFAQTLPDRHHWNQAVLLDVRPAFEVGLFEQSLQHLLNQHDALRMRFRQTPTGWEQTQAGPEAAAVAVEQIDLSALASAEQAAALEAEATRLQATLDLTDGPLARAVFFDCGPQNGGRLLIIIHHLVVDSVSWRILLEDLQSAYQQLAAGQPVALPPKTTAFQYWARQLTALAQTPAFAQELSYWLDHPWEQVVRLPVDGRGANTVASACSLTVSLSPAETQALLQEVPEVYQTQINEVLLAALAQAFAHWTGTRVMLVDLEGHGREPIFEEVDLSRTVGWFTSLFPVLLDLREAEAPGDVLNSTRAQLRRMPQRGLGYGWLRYAGPEPAGEQLARLPQAEVSFNYLGQFDQIQFDSDLFEHARGGSGLAHSARGNRAYLLEINGGVVGGRLQFAWSYSQARHAAATLEWLAATFIQELQALIAHCQSQRGRYQPSNFPDVVLSQDDLDDILAQLTDG